MPALRFAADAMLGRLARWLRVLGFDTSYDAGLADPELVRRASEEGRVLLTRDRHLLRELRPAQALEIRQDDPIEQLKAVIATLAPAGPPGLFTRCMLCNACLSDDLPDEEAHRLLPAAMAQAPHPVRHCPGCGRVYWHGSHVRRMRVRLEQALPGWMPEGADAVLRIPPSGG